MSTEISAVRAVNALETSETPRATDGLDLSPTNSAPLIRSCHRTRPARLPGVYGRRHRSARRARPRPDGAAPGPPEEARGHHGRWRLRYARTMADLPAALAPGQNGKKMPWRRVKPIPLAYRRYYTCSAPVLAAGPHLAKGSRR